MRAARGIVAPTLFIRKTPFCTEWKNGIKYRDYRQPDYECNCTEKHKTETPPDCPIWRKLRGMSPWELFGRSSAQDMERFVELPLGRVPLNLILKKELP